MNSMEPHNIFHINRSFILTRHSLTMTRDYRSIHIYINWNFILRKVHCMFVLSSYLFASISPSLHFSLTHSLQPSLHPSTPPSLTHLLFTSLPPSLAPSLTHSLPYSLPPLLPPSLPPSLPASHSLYSIQNGTGSVWDYWSPHVHQRS